MAMRTVLLIISLGVITACTKNWPLQITEVGKYEVELRLDRPSSEALSLRGMTLTWEGQNGVVGTVDLGLFPGTLVGGNFMIVWEDAGHSGAPEAARYSGGRNGYVDGIKVPAGFFNSIDTGAGMVSVSGSRTNALVVTHRVSDLVRFGSPTTNRPAGRGSFADTGVLGPPTGSAGPQRRWNSGSPVDTNSEDDWTYGVNSWGVETP